MLEAARGVCEANRLKLRAFCDERQLDLDKIGGVGGSEYFRPQIAAIDTLHAQYASLLPRGAGMGHPRECVGRSLSATSGVINLGFVWGLAVYRMPLQVGMFVAGPNST